MRNIIMKLKNVYHHLVYDGMYQSLDHLGNIVEVNSKWKSMLGYEGVDVSGSYIGDYISKDALLKVQENLDKVKQRGELINFACEMIRSDGRKVNVLIDGFAMYDASGKFTHTHCYIFTVESYKQLQEEVQYLIRQQDYLSSLLNEHVIYSSTDLKGIITDVSKAFCNETGYTREEMIGKNHNILRAKEIPDAIYKELWTTITSGHVWRGEIKNLRKNGETYWIRAVIHPVFDAHNAIEGYLAIRHDITREKMIEQTAVLDELTQIYNRRKFNAELEIALENYKRYGHSFALLMIDIDHFKEINDSYGHLVGDEVIKGVTRFIRMQIRQGDMLARWGGEEFVVILPFSNKENAMKRADNFREKIATSLCSALMKMCNVHEHVTCSVGVSNVEAEDTMDSLVGRVDRALYNAKENGRNCIYYL